MATRRPRLAARGARRLASSVELSARAREVDVAPEMPVAYGEQRARTDRSLLSATDRAVLRYACSGRRREHAVYALR